MKKKKVLICLITLGIILLIPIPTRYKDGGTVEYSAVLWSVTKHHCISEQNGVYGYNIGTTVKILWFKVHDDYPKFVS